jgi:hypothetical protein
MTDLDPNALNRALVIYEKSFPDAANITYDGVIAAIKVYLAALPRASGTPEAEAVAWRYLWKNDGPTARWRYVDADQRATFLHNLEEQPLYAAPPPVAAPPVDRPDIEGMKSEIEGYPYPGMQMYSYDEAQFDGWTTETAMSLIKYAEVLEVTISAPPVESQEMTREDQADALHGPLWRTAPDNRTAYEIVDCLRRDGFRIVRGAPKSGGE